MKEDRESEDAGKTNSGIQTVTESAMKLGEAIYKTAQQEAGEVEPDVAAADEDIVDADFEDLDSDKRA